MTPGRGLLNRSHTRCEPCRRWHGKCDAARPSCSTCVYYQRTCIYAGNASTDIGPGVAGSQFMRQSTELECRLVVVAAVLATLRRILWTDTADAFARRRERAVGRDDGKSGDGEDVGERDGDGDGRSEVDEDGGDDSHERDRDEEETANDDDSSQGDGNDDLDDREKDALMLAESAGKSESRVVKGPAEVSGPAVPEGDEIDDAFLQNLDPALRPT